MNKKSVKTVMPAFCRLACVLVWLALPAWANGQTTTVGVVVGAGADDVERYAADQLCDYLGKLYGLKVQPASELSAFAEVGLLVGGAKSNPAIRKALGDGGWPQVSDQGIVLKRGRLDGKPVLVVGGGSPRATLWAVYELVERWGVRYLLHGDVLPDKRGEFRLPQEDVVMEPTLRIRQWRVMNAHACGPESWGMADYRPVVDQLAKLKFNRIQVNLWAWQPFLDYEAGGIKRSSATLFFGFDFPITDDMPGRSLFGRASKFWNPDLPIDAGYDEFSAAGRQLIHNMMVHARQRGMECVTNAILDEFPPEFKPLLKGAQIGHQLGELTVVPGSGTDVFDPNLKELATAVLRATINSYPEADYLTLGVKEHRQWADHYEAAWKELDAKYRVEKARPLADILAAAGRRSSYPGGAERAIQEVKGDIVTLRYYDYLFNDQKVLQKTRRPDIKLIYNGFAEELCPVLPRIAPRGSETLNFVDYTPSRIVQRKDVLKNIGGSELPSTLIYTLHDDNVGVLPQLATGSLHALTGELRKYDWSGFSTRYWLIGDHEPCVAYLSRAAWDSTATPEATYRDQITAVCGEACVDDMLAMFREMEAATLTLEQHGLGLTFPVPGMLMNQWKATGMPAKLAEVRGVYQRALAAAERAIDTTTLRGKPYVQYWLGRLRFGIGYLDTVELMRRAATADSKGKAAEAVSLAEKALKEVLSCLEAYAGVAQDQSDRGALAVMGEFVYRPLKDKIATLKKKAQSAPAAAKAAKVEPAVRAVEFESRKVYESSRQPRYTSWVSFFPGERGQWYLTCEEVTKPEIPLPPCTTQQWYEMALPNGYDKSTYKMEMVMLESRDNLQTWKVISREPCRFHHSAGSFGQARTQDGRFLRFLWSCYSLDPTVQPSEIFYESADDGKTWKKNPPFHDAHFASHAHRLRTLRDGTLVLAVPLSPRWGGDSDRSRRSALRLDVNNQMQMTLFFSHDQGRSWDGPLPVYGGQNVSETDFVELPSGDLLLFNNSIFANPGRQFVYRGGKRFTPGPLERVRAGQVPETVCMTGDGILVGCMRAGQYSWSDDLGQTWQKLDGIPRIGLENYQPWIQILNDGRIACAGHCGLDDALGKRDQYVSLHLFRLQVLHKTKNTRLHLVRDYDEAAGRWPSRFTLSLTCDGAPLADKELEFWFVERDKPGYDGWNKTPLEQRMKLGGKSIVVHTQADGKAHVALPHLDQIENNHYSYEVVVRFNADGKDRDYKPAMTPQFSFYANSKR